MIIAACVSSKVYIDLSVPRCRVVVVGQQMKGPVMKSEFEEGVENLYSAVSNGRAVRQHGPYGILVGDERLEFFPHVVGEPVVSGAQLLDLARVAQPGECLLYQVLTSGVIEEVRPEQSIDLRAAGAEKFIVFRSDRSFRFFLNERSFDWGATHISGGTLKHLAAVQVSNHDVWLTVQDHPPRLVENAQFVDLGAPGVERFVTTSIKIAITVNARRKEVDCRRVSYWEIVKLAFPEAQPSENVIYTIDYAFGPHQNPEGSLAEGQNVFVKEGMKFYVTPTDKS